MSLPNLNQRLTLETPVRQSDGAGGFSETWATLGELWAELQAGTGGKSTSTGAPVSRGRYKITVRGARVGDPQRPVAQQRFRMGGRLFAILAVMERDGVGHYLTCFVQEEVAT